MLYIKEYNTIKIGKHCPIKVDGDLKWIINSDKEGYGFSVEYDGTLREERLNEILK